MKSFEILHGDPESRVILHVPHSSRFIPNEVRSDLLLDTVELERELDEITDTLTDVIALEAIAEAEVKCPRPSVFKNAMSRLVIDPERFPDEREPMNKIGMGAVYRRSSSGMALRRDDYDDEPLLTGYFHPYAQEFTALVDSKLSRHGQVVIIDVHSYRTHQHANALNSHLRRPAMCIGTDSFHTSKTLIEIFRDAFGKNGDCVENEPYAGTYVPLKHYGQNRNVQSIMMETRADTFLNERLEPHDGFNRVTSALAEALFAIHDAGRF